MKLTFLGTRGYVKTRTRRHRRHSSLLVAYKGRKVMVDCGEDWRGDLFGLAPDAVCVTHGHPDHAFGLSGGAPCPVYASAETWDTMRPFPIRERFEMTPAESEEIAGMTVTFFPADHSTRAPAGGFRIVAGAATIFYIPDVVYIRDRSAALQGVKLYVGDGATLERPMVRRRGDSLIGHTPVRTQLTWCGKEGVPRAVFTHCGSQFLKGDERTLGARLRALARERGVEAGIAYDGMEVVLR